MVGMDHLDNKVCTLFFKKLTQNIGNFINLPYTLTLRHYSAITALIKWTIRSTALIDIGPGEYCTL